MKLDQFRLFLLLQWTRTSFLIPTVLCSESKSSAQSKIILLSIKLEHWSFVWETVYRCFSIGRAEQFASPPFSFIGAQSHLKDPLEQQGSFVENWLVLSVHCWSLFYVSVYTGTLSISANNIDFRHHHFPPWINLNLNLCLQHNANQTSKISYF